MHKTCLSAWLASRLDVSTNRLPIKCQFQNLRCFQLYWPNWDFSKTLAVKTIPTMAHPRLAAWLICAGVFSVTGCSGPPSEAEAAVAVRRLFADAGSSMFGAQLPIGAIPSSVHLGECLKQDAPAGHVCSVTVVTEEISILGAFSLPMTLRFAKREHGWQAYLN